VTRQRFAVLHAGLLAVLALPAAPLFAQQRVPEIPFTSVPNYPNLPAGMNFGEVPGVAVNSRGHVFVFSRSNSATGPAFGAAAAELFEFDQNGTFVREIGKGLYAWSEAHSVRIDRNDNIWAIDKGSNMVVRFNPLGRVVWVFGRRQEAADGAEPLGHPDPPLPPVDGNFRQPTDIAWDSQGNSYITDGYINSRVAKFDKNGDWVKSWGSKGSGPGQFNIPHSIAIDRQDNVYVGDRTNHRIEVFDTDGNFKRMFSIEVPPDPTSKAVNGATPTGDRLKQAIGAPNSMCITPGPVQVLFVGESTYPGRIFKVALDGTVLGVIGRSGRNLGQFSGAHAIACPSEREIYVGETSNWRVQKLLLR
jgi:sugar lactone lactonase YvrE